MNREVDIIIFGASGFTGEYVVLNLVQYLSQNKQSKIKWGIAGRSKSKLESVLNSVSIQTGQDLSQVPIFEADLDNIDAMTRMSSKTRVLLNCTGPFRYFGEKVIKSCLVTKTHYLDITGEPQFMEEMQLKYDEAARAAGVYIIPSCGFDSIPADLGVDYTKDNFDGNLNSITSFIISNSMSFNSTSWDCFVDGYVAKNELKKIRAKLSETQFSQVPKIAPRFKLDSKFVIPYQDQNLRYRTVALKFNGADRSVVKRSQMSNFIFWGEKDFVQFEAYTVQPILRSLLIPLTGLVLITASKFKSGPNLIKKFPRIFSFGTFRTGGPSRQEVDSGSFSMTFHGKGWPKNSGQDSPPTQSIKTRVSGPHPGYPACSICLNQSALTLLAELDKFPSSGGSFTPSTAFKKTTLLERLQKNGIKFEVISKQ